jgi:2-polyprenyl-3-methyl-5-hydroxy-6-metoxy-1,4-benzoquinol methylase
LFDTYEADFDLDVPADPDSLAYRQKQFALYERLHGKPYAVTNERSPMDVMQMARSPYPYIHGSAALVGDQLMGIGYIIKQMGLPKGARVLEFGPGWGNTTLAMAKMGYQVLAIDIEQNFVDLIQERARMERIDSLEVRHGDFLDIEALPANAFDAVLFFECFHHCSDHQRLVAAFDRVLKPGGQVCMAAEPIVDDFPLPWGLRMDGQSLWAIRRNGWLELGFNSKYFRALMASKGWAVQRHQGTDGSLSSLWLGQRLSGTARRWTAADARVSSTVGCREGEGVRSDGRAGYLAFGPYLPWPEGSWRAEVELGPAAAGSLVVDVVSGGGQLVHAELRLDLAPNQTLVQLPFELTAYVSDLEVRVWCAAGTQALLRMISLHPQGLQGGAVA